MTHEENKQSGMHPWAYRWAKRLEDDIHQSLQFVMELERLTAWMTEESRENVRIAMSWMVAAYYEHLKGRWTEERMQKQIHEAEKRMEMELIE